MRHPALDDAEAVDRLHVCLLEWARRLASPKYERPFHRPEPIEAQSFRAEIEIRPDYEHAGASSALTVQGRDALAVRLQSHEPGSAECYIDLYQGTVARPSEKPREWRSISRGMLGHPDLHAAPVLLPGCSPLTYTPAPWKRTRMIYWSPQAPPDDLKAQILVALLQLRVLPQDSSLAGWLPKYLKRNFWIMGKDSKAVANSAGSHILMYWGQPEDFRGWRKYVRTILAKEARQVGFSRNLEADKVRDPGEEEKRQLGRLRRRITEPRDRYSVAHVSATLGVSRQAVYQLIASQKILTLEDRPTRIAADEVKRLLAVRNMKLAVFGSARS